MHETPTPEQIDEAARQGAPLPLSYYAFCATVAAAILGALAVVLDVRWLFAIGPTL